MEHIFVLLQEKMALDYEEQQFLINVPEYFNEENTFYKQTFIDILKKIIISIRIHIIMPYNKQEQFGLEINSEEKHNSIEV